MDWIRFLFFTVFEERILGVLLFSALLLTLFYLVARRLKRMGSETFEKRKH